jgi:nitrite reductase/ring-hydroxylating ferredoxin subunit
MSPLDRRVLAPDLSGALGDIVGHREDSLGLFVKQQVVISESPVMCQWKFWVFHLERGDVGEQVALAK